VFRLFNKATSGTGKNVNLPQTGAFLIGNVLNRSRFLSHILVPMPEDGFMKKSEVLSSYHVWENKMKV
jgi:hypothetical protein